MKRIKSDSLKSVGALRVLAAWLLLCLGSGTVDAQFVLSEFMAVNDTTLNDDDGSNSDWVEIHNEGLATANLGGWHLTDTTNNLAKWRFPSTNVAPNARLVVFASGKDRVSPGGTLHANFRLSGDGEYLALVMPDGVTIATEFHPAYPPQIADVSYGLVRSSASVGLLGANAPATAFVPGDDSLGLNWTGVEFDDSAWLGGTTAVGYDRQVLGVNFLDYIGLNIEAVMYNENSSAYVRVPFTVTNPGELDGLTLKMRFEDGFIAYLNGVEVARSNAPAMATWNSGATAPRTDTAATNLVTMDISDQRDLLQVGANVLAIHALNIPVNSPDILVGPELEGLTLSGASVGRYFTTPTPGASNGEGVEALGPIIRDPAHTPDQPGNNDDIQVVARVLAAFAPVGSVSLKYRVMFGAEVTVGMFDDGAHGDGAAGDGIFGGVIPSAASASGQMVRWYIFAADTTATNQSRLPAATRFDAPAYFGTVIRDPALNNPLPVFHWFVQNVAATDTGGGTRCSVYYAGEFYDNLFCRVRGASAPSFPKKPYKFDFNPGHHFRFLPGQPRVDEINLNTTYQDKAHLRAPLTFETYRRAGVPASDAFNVRLQQNGVFFSVTVMTEQVDETYMERRQLDPDGALYKLFNGVTSSTSGVEKKTRRHENNNDLQQLVNAVAPGNPNRGIDVFDKVDLPATINYLAAGTISQDWDRSAKNLYLYRDTEGDGLWTMLPWDKDLTFGKAALLSDVVVGNKDGGPDLGSEEEKISHPFYGSPAYNCCGVNNLMDAVYSTAATREMYLRRVRTLMDELLQPPGTPVANLWFEARLDQLQALLNNDAVLDLNRWGTGYGQPQSLATAVQAIKTDYLAARRVHLYQTHGVDNVGQYGPAVGVPHAQVGSPVLQFGAVEFSPLSGNQLEEYVELLNPNGMAVDLSGWQLQGAVSFTFEPGTVVPSGGRIYVSPHVNTFRTRASGPRAGQGLLVVGNYAGQLSARGETLRLLDRQSTVIATNTYPGNPSAAQQFLRITEIMYRPAPVNGITNAVSDLEFIELRNISSSAALDLTGVRLVDGVTFDFGSGAVTELAPGQHLVVVGNLAAYTEVHGAGSVAGEFDGLLDNGGERLRLFDGAGEEILDFDYDNDWYPITDGHGFSLVVVDELAEPDRWGRAGQWRASSLIGGSPGAIDPFPPVIPSVVITEVLSRTDFPPPTDSIELHNPSAGLADVSGWFVTDDPGTAKKFRIPDNTVIAAGGYLVLDESDFNPQATGFAFSALGDEAFLFSGDAQTNLTGYVHGFGFGAAENGVSFGRHLTSVGEEHFVAQEVLTLGSSNAGPRVGPLIVSEIMYHPLTTGVVIDDPLAILLGTGNGAVAAFDPEGNLEYVELANLSAQSLPLFHPDNSASTWRVRGAVDFDFPPNLTLDPGAVVVLVGFDPDANIAARTQFETFYALSPGTALLGPWQGSLGNNRERIQIQKPDVPVFGTVPRILVDTAEYQDQAPWPVGADGAGSSLQRRVPSAYGNDPTNWFAAGRSPGLPNVFNELPLITLTNPTNGAVFNESDSILLAADTSDPDGSVSSVRFFSGTGLLGEVTVPPFEFVWTNPVFGNHTLTAEATDDRFATAVSDPIAITVEARLPTVAISSPTNGARLLNSEPIPLVVSATDADGFIALVEYFSDGVKLGERAELPFVFHWTNAPVGTRELQAAATDNSGNRVFSDQVTILVASGFTAGDTLIQAGAVWRYLDLGVDQGTAWRSPAFDDTTWASGPAPLGYGDGDEATVVGFGPDAGNKYITTYFRRTFAVSNVMEITLLNLEILRDDGAAVYINGTEAFRTGLPEGPITFGTLANIVVIDGDESTNFFPAVLDPALLVEGLNTVAVEIHQRSGDSSDISFDLKLDVVRTVLAPVILRQPINQLVSSGADVTLSVDAAGTEPLQYQWRLDGSDIPGANGSSLTLNNVQFSDGGAYSVLVSNPAGMTLSENAFLAVTVPGNYSATVLADGPVHYYRFEEDNTALPAVDEGTPGGSHGTYTGGLILNQVTAPVLLGGAALFDGEAGTFVDLGLFHPGNSVTVEAWIMLDPAARGSSFHAIVARWDGSFELDIATDDRPNLVVRNQSNAFGLVAGPDPIVRGRWHHLAGAYDNGILRMHVDGREVATAVLGGTLRNGGPSPDRVLIGGTRNGFSSSFNWRGLIDEVAIYDRALEPGRILAHYHAALPALALRIDSTGEISWPAFPGGSVLQVAETLTGPTEWQPADVTGRVEEGGRIKLTVPLSGPTRFYRLFLP